MNKLLKPRSQPLIPLVTEGTPCVELVAEYNDLKTLGRHKDFFTDCMREGSLLNHTDFPGMTFRVTMITTNLNLDPPKMVVKFRTE